MNINASEEYSASVFGDNVIDAVWLRFDRHYIEFCPSSFPDTAIHDEIWVSSQIIITCLERRTRSRNTFPLRSLDFSMDLILPATL
jgi:hypothetical protein